MNFKMEEAIEILERTPQTLAYFLTGLSDRWVQCDEGEGTWNATEVIDHLIEGEVNNWVPRLIMILEEGEDKPFPPFDRFSHLNKQYEKSLIEKLDEFTTIRAKNMTKLKMLINPTLHLELKGTHPAFGGVKLRELLATWVVHDLTHLAQIVRVMAKSYKHDVGPWKEYLSILKDER